MAGENNLKSIITFFRRNEGAAREIEEYAAKNGETVMEAFRKLYPGPAAVIEKSRVKVPDVKVLATGPSSTKGEGFSMRSPDKATEGRGFTLRDPVDPSKLPVVRKSTDIVPVSKKGGKVDSAKDSASVPESARINKVQEFFTPEADQKAITQPSVDAANQKLKTVHELLGPLPEPPASSSPNAEFNTKNPSSLQNRINQYGKVVLGGGLAGAGVVAGDQTGKYADAPKDERSEFVTAPATPEQKPAIPTLGTDGRSLKDAVKAGVTPPPEEEKKVTPEQIADMLPEKQMKPAKKAAKPAAEEDKEDDSGEEKPEPTPVQKILEHFSKQLKDTRGEIKKDLQGQLGEMKDLETTYRNEAQAAKDSTARQELAEKMGHALAQLGAGMQGLKTGVDMSSGLKFDKTDWNKRYEAALDELKANLSDLREKRQEARLTSQEAQREAEREAERSMSLATQEQIRGEDREERAKEKEEQLKSAASLRAEDRAFREKESKERRDWEQKQFGDTMAFKKEALHWNEQQRDLDRHSKEKIEQFKASLKQSAVDKKLTEKDQAGSDAAAGALLGAWSSVAAAEGPKEKLLAEKRARQLESDPKVTKYLTPTAIQQARKTAQGTPSTIWNFWKGKEGDISAAERQLNLGRIVRTGGASQGVSQANAPAPAPATAPAEALQPTADELSLLKAYQKQYPNKSPEEILKAMRRQK